MFESAGTYISAWCGSAWKGADYGVFCCGGSVATITASPLIFFDVVAVILWSRGVF